MVIPARVELATYRLGGGCSILLSYGNRLKHQYAVYYTTVPEKNQYQICKKTDFGD